MRAPTRAFAVLFVLVFVWYHVPRVAHTVFRPKNRPTGRPDLQPPGCVTNTSSAYWAQGATQTWPVLSLPGCERHTQAQALAALAGHHLVFLGDSVTRYQYVNLVYFLRTGLHAAAEGDQPNEWNDPFTTRWSEWYAQTASRTGDLCDCYRQDSVFSPAESYENRYWEGPRDTRVTYFALQGRITMKGHARSQLQGLCKPGFCSGPAQWTAESPREVASALRDLRPTHVIVGSYLWTDTWGAGAAFSTDEVIAMFATIKSLPSVKHVIWKSGTPRVHEALAGTTSAIDRSIVQAVRGAGHGVFDAALLLSALFDRGDKEAVPWVFADKIHFAPGIYAELNHALLSQLSQL